MSLEAFFRWQEATAIATAIRETDLLFPLIESIHVLAITLVIGTIAIVDLRLLGVASLERRVTKVMGELLPFTWVAFIIATMTGGLLFSSNAAAYFRNFYLDSKLVLLVLAGVNMFVFHLFISRGIVDWDASPHTPWGAKLAGGASILIWIGVVACGRWIGFTMMAP
jgi:hypothetical protein